MRVLVCGGRNYRDRARLTAVLNKLNDAGDGDAIDLLIQGGAPGADRMASEWSYANAVAQAQFDADWDTHGTFAGPMRNARMLAEGKPDLVIAFPGGRGTADMVKKARKAGVEVIEIAEAS